MERQPDPMIQRMVEDAAEFHRGHGHVDIRRQTRAKACTGTCYPDFMKVAAAQIWIRRLKLKPHPEGGYYREAYRSSERIPGSALPARYKGKPRSFSTLIYYLLEGNQVSRLHRLCSDEIWCFHAGSGLTLRVKTPSGRFKKIRLGVRPEKKEIPHVVIPRDCWFGAEVSERNSYALVSCLVAPGFDFTDFELASSPPHTA